MDEATQSEAQEQEQQDDRMSGYHRVKNPTNFGALLRAKRVEAKLTIRDIHETVGTAESVISCVERADQTVFRADIIEKIRAAAQMLGIERAFITTELTKRQWRKHSRPHKNAAKKAAKQERDEYRRLEREAREQDAAERKKQYAEQPPGRLWIPDTSGLRAPVTPPPPPPETFPDLNDQMGQIKLFVKLNAKGILSDAALTIALRDLLRGGNK